MRAGKLEFAGHRAAAAAVTAVVAAALIAAPGATAKPTAAKLQVKAPATATAGSPVAVKVTALSSKGKRNAAYKGKVTLRGSDGSAASYRYGTADKGKHVFTATPSAAGSLTLKAKDAAKRPAKGKAKVAVKAGQPSHELVRLEVSTPGSVAAGEQFSPQVRGYDAQGEPVEGAASKATLEISPEGSCSAGVCSTERAVEHTVTAKVGSVKSQAKLGVMPAVAATITIDSPTQVVAGQKFTTPVSASDEFGNSIDTSGAQLRLTPDGSCDEAGCRATNTGPHKVIATVGSMQDEVPVAVVAGPTQSVSIQAPGSVKAGTGFSPKLSGSDAYGNSTGVIESAVFALAGGQCNAGGCSTGTAGSHELTGKSGAFTASTSVKVEAGPIATIAISPADGSVGVAQPNGANARYERLVSSTLVLTARGSDAYGNSLGDITSQTAFKVGGTPCNPAACSSPTPGMTTVTASYGGATAATSLHVKGYDATYKMFCQGANWDINDNMADGCEVAQPAELAGHGTRDTAIDLGSLPCSDSASSRSVSGSVFSDYRFHEPEPLGGYYGSEPVWYKVRATGGLCTNDIWFNVRSSGGRDNSQYALSVVTDKLGTRGASFGGNDGADHVLSNGSGSYSDNSTIYFRVGRVAINGPEIVDYTVDFHL